MRQYIGARYVPTYYQNSLDPTSSEWEANVQYDPLTIVSLPNLHSYQSKKFVPANIGSPASNPEYWYDQGYANAYFQALQDQIDDMNDGTVPGSLQNQIDDNASDITALMNKSLILIAASYGLTPSESDNCIVNLKTMASNVYANIYDASQHGAKFSDGSYLTLLQGLESSIDEPNSVTDIVVIGHGNDVGTAWADVLSAMTTFSTYAKAHYPRAKVSIAPVSVYPDPTGELARITMLGNMIGYSSTHKISIMTDIAQILALNYDIYTGADNWHPSSAGAMLIAEGIYNMLTVGSFNTHIRASDGDTTSKTFASYIRSVSGYFDDVYESDLNTIATDIFMTFVADTTGPISQSSYVTKLMTCHKGVKGVAGNLNYISARSFIGFLSHSGDSVPVRIAYGYDNGAYWYYIQTLNGTDVTLVAGDTYTLRAHGIIPFTYA